MKILLVISLLTILVISFPVGILFSLLAKKLSKSNRSLWSYCKALLLLSLAIFLAIYLPAFVILKAGWSLALMASLLIVLFGLIAWFYQKDWARSEKLATTAWGLLVFLGILFLITNFSLFNPFVINDIGMDPVYSKGDFVFCQLNKALTFGYSKGNVVVFQDPHDKNKTLIRKIIATQGDRVKIDGGQLFVNDQLIRKVRPNELIAPITLTENQYFVLAENSENTYDSKLFGPITKADIYIRVMFKLNWLKK